jgi:hypothetical protein
MEVNVRREEGGGRTEKGGRRSSPNQFQPIWTEEKEEEEDEEGEGREESKF